MRIGIETILWGWGTASQDIDIIAAAAQELGYEGLEIGQPPYALGPAKRLKEILHSHNLEIVGLAGGSIQSRIEYAAESAPQYLYLDEWDEEAVHLAISRGFTVGLHPHLYKSIDSMEAAESYLEKVPELGLILDTAHLYLAGDDIHKALERYGERVLAVHLKDWTNQYGISPVRFSRGFTELGGGDIGEILRSTVSYLIESEYGGWIIVEQNAPRGRAFDSARKSREWLSRIMGGSDA